MVNNLHARWKGATLLLLLSLSLGSTVFAQVEWACGIAPEFRHSWRLQRAWRLSAGAALEARPLFSSQDPQTPAPPALRNIDLNFAVTRRWFALWHFGTGLRARSRYPGAGLNEDPKEDEAVELRSWFWAERRGAIRYTRWEQRWRVEQRWRGDIGDPLVLTHRWRYLVGMERALQGIVVDEGEWFLLASAELLLSSRGLVRDVSSLDLRPYLAVGRGNFEYGIEYRHEWDREDYRSRQQTLLLVFQYSLP